MRAEALSRTLGLPVVALRPAPTRIDALGEGRFAWREDLAGGPVGGAKVRKVEWLLGLANRGGGDVLTLGPAGGQHLLAASVYGRAHGLRVHAVAWPCPRTGEADQNLRAVHAHAEHVWPAPSRSAALAVLARAFATVRVQAGYAPEVWGPGGSDPPGTLAWVQAGMELAEAVAAGAMPAPPRVWVAAGSGGTAAGLWLGCALGGLSTELVAVDVTGLGRRLVEAQAWRARRALEARGVPVPRPGPLRVVAEESAYGALTEAGERAAGAADAQGLHLDATYAAKAYAVALTEGPGCFIATSNGQPFEPLLRTALPTLPARLGCLLEDG